MSGAQPRPAFYALAPGGWRDYVTLLHPPYTLWHLSYVAIGAALAPRMDWRVFGLTLLAFALALGVGAHALDELRGRPLGTHAAPRTLAGLAAVSIAAAAGIGIGVALERNLWLLAFVACGAFLVVAYNLELFGGTFHGDLWFALAWGAFPVLTAAFAVAERLRADALIAAAGAAVLSHAQRTLSARVRTLRRRVATVTGEIEYRDGERTPFGADELAAAPERALRLLAVATALLAAALVVRHLL